MSFKRFSSFSLHQLEAISQLLQSKNIPFEVFVDQELIDHFEAEWKAQGTNVPLKAGATYNVRPLCFDIDDQHVDQVLQDDELQKWGFQIHEQNEEEVDFNAQDYLCPRCDHHQTQTGLCPKHQVPLITFQELHQIQEKRGSEQMRNLLLAFIGVALLFLAWVYTRH